MAPLAPPFPWPMVLQHRLNIRQPFPAKDDTFAPVENHEHLSLEDAKDYIYIRSPNCFIFIDIEAGNLCSSCKSYGTDHLKKCRQRMMKIDEPETKKKRTSFSSTTNLRYLSRDELEERLLQTQSKKRETSQKLARMSQKIGQEIANSGTNNLDEDQHRVLCAVMNNQSNPAFEEDSPQWLLWEQQQRNEMASFDNKV